MDPASIIVLDSSDEESGEPKRRKLGPPAAPLPLAASDGMNGSNNHSRQLQPQNLSLRSPTDPSNKIRRIKPITVATNLSKESAENNNRHPVNDNFAIISYSDEWEKDLKKYQQILNDHEKQQQTKLAMKKRSPLLEEEMVDRKTATPGSSSTADSHTTSNTTASRRSEKKEKEKKSAFEKNPIGKEFADLLNACRKADTSPEMELLIQKKLIKYYECVHPDYINSKSFKKTVTTVTEEVTSNPELVYLKLSSIVEELNIRRKSRDSVMTNENITSTGSERKDNQIRRLNRALYILKKRIAKLEEMEVDFEEEINSAYLMQERYKKRAFEIYEKICDITGESKHAHRVVRKPIKFDGTHYPEFNRTIQTFVNRTSLFPDYFDVLKCLQHCNTQYGYRMRRDEMTKIAQDAFIKIGKLLQKRRKTDLYETVSYYSGAEKDPALVDRKLLDKLEDNKKLHRNVDDVIDKFARVQDKDTDDENELEPEAGASKSHNTKPSTSTSSGSKSPPSTSTKVDAEKGESDSKLEEKHEDTGSSSQVGSPAVAHSENDETKKPAEITTGDSSRPPSITEDAKEEPAKEGDKVDGKESTQQPADDLEDDEDDDDDEDEEEDEMVIKENVKPDTFDDIEISDDEELVVPS
ncbi:daxx-like protein [Uranotaenia lowii]|uniref:daxx-like protein n=1 Tax=Uranotaenia lowii TaxID=190385 RepID=UPI00247A5BD3|nr:daxx-like protein [Uranotaenia lowii]XP_055613478.1 daxx-like protein [Uranotaenia lowii]